MNIEPTNDFLKQLDLFIKKELFEEGLTNLKIKKFHSSSVKIINDNIYYYYRLELSEIKQKKRHDIFYVADNKNFIGGNFYIIKHHKYCDRFDCELYDCIDNSR
jgi:hypothetical protein